MQVLRRVLATRAELGDAAAAATHELSDDPVLASYQAVALSPFGAGRPPGAAGGADGRGRVDRLRALLDDEAACSPSAWRWRPADRGGADGDAPR